MRVAAPDVAAAHTAREQVRALVAGAGRDPDAVAVLLDVDPGTEGIVEFVAAVGRRGRWRHAARRPVPDLAARLAERGLRRPVAPDATLRERFGLPRPANFFAGARQ